MATVDEIMAALASGNRGIAEQNPYTGLTSTADQIGGLIVKSANKDNWKEAAIASAISGLVGGGLNSLSSNYQMKKQKVYQDAVLDMIAGNQVDQGNLSGGLYDQAMSAADLFKVQQGVKQADEQRAIKNALMAQAAQTSVANNPNAARDVLSKMLGVEIDSTPQPIAIPADIAKNPEANAMFKQEYNSLIEMGVPPNQAAQTARAGMNAILKESQEEQKALLKEQTESFKKVDEAAAQGEALGRMVDQLEYYVDNAGNTGFGGGMSQMLAKGLAGVSDSQSKKAAAGEQLESLGADIVRTARQAGSGPMSDRDVQLYLSSGPKLTNTEEANKEIINRMRYAATLQSGYADFMRQKRDAGVPLLQAQQAWQDTVKQNPYVVKDPKTNKLISNDAWLQGLTGAEKASATEAMATTPTVDNVVTKIGKDGRSYRVKDLGNGKYELLD